MDLEVSLNIIITLCTCQKKNNNNNKGEIRSGKENILKVQTEIFADLF